MRRILIMSAAVLALMVPMAEAKSPHNSNKGTQNANVHRQAQQQQNRATQTWAETLGIYEQDNGPLERDYYRSDDDFINSQPGAGNYGLGGSNTIYGNNPFRCSGGPLC